LPASNVTPAVLFRAIKKWQPTLLIDEADTFLAGAEELRGMLNAGHNRAYAYVLRAVGEDYEPKQFKVWAPKALGKIGGLPPTLHGRSIQIKLQRKRANEEVVPLRADRLEHLDPLRRKAARWVADNSIALKSADPELPKTLHGRMADNWRPLFAIADRAGGKWRNRAREIAQAAASKASDETAGIILLADIESIFERFNIERIHSDELVSHLGAMEDRPWAEWGKAQKPLTQNQLADLLKPFDVVPKQMKIEGINKRGYELESLKPLFTRYKTATPLHPWENKELRGIQNATGKTPVAFQAGNNASEIEASSAVAPHYPLDREKSLDEGDSFPDFFDWRRADDGDPFAGLRDPSFGLQPRKEKK
jgi:putative DNA primase/helicase